MKLPLEGILHEDLCPAMNLSLRKSTFPTIALITDFGQRDWYVGSIKGQILKHHAEARIVDISHQIPPGDIWAASYVLASCLRDFPDGTLFMVVVDPGVGTARKCILGRIGQATVLCPNNGILSHCLHEYANQQGPFFEIVPDMDPKSPISATFHGRDVFAPVAGKIAAGTLHPDGLGPIVHDLVVLPISKAELKPGSIHGTVQYVDHFGNAITNICQSELRLLRFKPGACVQVHQTLIPLRSTFGEVEEGQPLTYIGSNGFLEVAVNRGSAARQLKLKAGQQVTLHLDEVGEGVGSPVTGNPEATPHDR